MGSGGVKHSWAPRCGVDDPRALVRSCDFLPLDAFWDLESIAFNEKDPRIGRVPRPY